MLVDCADRPVAGVGQRAGSEDGIGGGVDHQAGAIDEHEVHSRPFRFFLVLLLVLIPASQHKTVITFTLRLLGVAIRYSGDFLVEDAVMDVGLFGVEVFIEGGPDDAVGVDGYSELLSDFGDIGIVPGWEGGYLRSPPSCEKTSRLPPFSTNRLRSSISVGVKVSLGAAMMKRWAFLIFSKSMVSLLRPIWVLHIHTL